MKLYKIRDWEIHFENNRSKAVENLRWVLIPNKHDGENFVTIIKSKHGAEIFAAWVLIIQVASKCHPRGTLMRGNCKPHTPATLSIKTGAPEAWFKIALDFLEEHTDWLDIQEVAGDCQLTATQVPPDGIEVLRREGIEEKEMNEPSIPPASLSKWHLALGLELPENLQTDNCLSALNDWLAYKRERRTAYKTVGLKTLLAKLSREFTAAELPMAIERSISNNWQGIFKQDNGNAQAGSNTPSKHPPGQEWRDDPNDWRHSL